MSAGQVVNVDLSGPELRRVATDAVRDVGVFIAHDHNFEDPAPDWTAAKLRDVKADVVEAFDRAIELVELVEAMSPGSTLSQAPRPPAPEPVSECGETRTSGDRCAEPAGHAGDHRSKNTGETWPKEDPS